MAGNRYNELSTRIYEKSIKVYTNENKKASKSKQTKTKKHRPVVTKPTDREDAVAIATAERTKPR